jgi:hypothetical protein
VIARLLLVALASAGCAFATMTPPRPGFEGAMACSASNAPAAFDVLLGVTAGVIAATKLDGVIHDEGGAVGGDAALGIGALVLVVPLLVSAVHGYGMASECARAKEQALKGAEVKW